MELLNTSKLHKELETAGIPIHGVSSDGRIDFKEEATQEQRSLAEQIVAQHNPDAKTPEELALEAARQRSAANPVNENEIAQANSVVALREQVLKMQVQIAYLLLLTNTPTP